MGNTWCTNKYSVYDLWCVYGDYTVYFNALTQYGMYATHCIIWYLEETVEKNLEVSIPYFKIPKYIEMSRNGPLYVLLH